MIELENESHVARAPAREPTIAHLLKRLAVDDHFAGCGAVDTAENVKKGRFARSGRTHQRQEVAARHVEVEMLQNFDALRSTLEGFRDTLQVNERKRLQHVLFPRGRKSHCSCTSTPSLSSPSADTITCSPPSSPPRMTTSPLCVGRATTTRLAA